MHVYVVLIYYCECEYLKYVIHLSWMHARGSQFRVYFQVWIQFSDRHVHTTCAQGLMCITLTRLMCPL